ncbi:hypothetical protein [Arsenophonus endosymbiont of Lipoptena cervi]|uniref:hypothetical protein n=1 Tax=Arsenophonus endosymbiont of Lipoptena cervi TaxID=363258 RepID=UPI001F3CE7A6
MDVSHQISAILDIEDSITVIYNLEISSLGIELLLFIISAHYKRFISKEVNLTLKIKMHNCH